MGWEWPDGVSGSIDLEEYFGEECGQATLEARPDSEAMMHILASHVFMHF